MSVDFELSPLGKIVWEDRYALKDKDGKTVEKDISETFQRVAKAIASKEADPKKWEKRFYEIMAKRQFCPAGRILAHSGTHYSQLLNCFVLPFEDDSLESIMNTAKNMAIIFKYGGGCGFNYSTLRPGGSYIKGVNGHSCGVIGFIHMMSTISEVIEQGGSRRAASLGLLEVWHPDIWEFISYKNEHNWERLSEFVDIKDQEKWQAFKFENLYKWQMYNVSVGVSDEFMEAVKEDKTWPLLWEGEWELYTIVFKKALNDGTFKEVKYEVSADNEETALWKVKKYIPFPTPNDKFEIVSRRKIKAKEIWDMICYNAWSDGCPGLINMSAARKMHNIEYVSPLIGTNPCGEQILSGQGSCNLSSLILSSFVINGVFDFDLFKQTIHTGVRFADNVIDNCFFPLKDIEEKAFKERRVGIGVMAVHDMLIKMGLGYDTQEGRDAVEKVLEVLRDETYKASIKLSKEKGCFPLYDADKFLESGFIKTLPDKIQKEIKEFGIRNSTLTSIAPTGCLVKGSLISTSKGFLKIGEIFSVGEKEFKKQKDRSFFIADDMSKSQISHLFNNGKALTKKIVTKKGYSLEGTFNHKIRILTKGLGYAWKKLEDIEVGDKAVLKKGGLIIKKETWIRPELAKLLGFYMADGWWSSSWNPNKKSQGHRLYFSFNSKDEELQKEIKDSIKKMWESTFKITSDRIKIKSENNSLKFNITNAKLYRWFEKYKCLKEGAENAFIPDIILQSSKECLIEFIKGYWMGDGSFNKKKKIISFKTISKKLAEQLQIVLLGIGFSCSIYKGYPPKKDIFIEGRKIKIIKNSYAIEVDSRYTKELLNLFRINPPFEYAIRTKELVPVFSYELHRHKFPFASKFDKDDVYIGIDTYKEIVPEKDWNWFVSNNLMVDVVKDIETSKKRKETFDITVRDRNHSYIANGFVTHNTIGALFNVSTGCEPWFSLSFQRNTRLGSYEDGCPGYLRWKEEAPEGTPVPSYFKTAQEILPEDHIAMLILFSKYVDSSVSKTINLPSSATVDDVKKTFMMAMDNGVKGVTVFRDQSKEGVFISKKIVEEAKKAIDDLQNIHDDLQIDSRMSPKKRNNRVVGATYRVHMQNHNLYITANRNENGDLIEVFATVGESRELNAFRTSGVEDSWAEGLGKIISLALRAGVEPDSIIRNLKNIPSDKPIFTSVGDEGSSEMIPSPPHAIGRVIEEELRHLKLIDETNIVKKPCDNCGSINTNMKSPTCYECLDCFHVTCG